MVELLPDVLKAQFIAGLRETLYRVIFMLKTHKLDMNFSNTNPSFLFIKACFPLTGFVQCSCCGGRFCIQIS